jgi:hypothetical protein
MSVSCCGFMSDYDLKVSYGGELSLETGSVFLRDLIVRLFEG